MAKLTTLRSKKGRRLGFARGRVLNLDKPTKKAVTKIAQKVLNKAAESKYVAEVLTADQGYAVYGSTLPTGGIPQIFDVLPSLQEGSGEFQRNGVKITPTKHYVDLDLRFATGNTIDGTPAVDNCAWDINVHIWYGTVKRYKYSGDVITEGANILANLLDNGDGSTSAWEGGIMDHMKVVNKEWFNLKHKVVRMYRPLGDQNTASMAGGVTTYFPQAIHKTMRLNFSPPKVLLYNEDNAEPENYAPVVIIGYQHNDLSQASNKFGSATPPVLAVPAISMNMREHLWFKDL